MQFCVLALLFLLIAIIMFQPVREVWKNIEEYENMKRVGFKPFKDEKD